MYYSYQLRHCGWQWHWKKPFFFKYKNCKLKQHERERHIMPCVHVDVGGFDDLYMNDVDKV